MSDQEGEDESFGSFDGEFDDLDDLNDSQTDAQEEEEPQATTSSSSKTSHLSSFLARTGNTISKIPSSVLQKERVFIFSSDGPLDYNNIKIISLPHPKSGAQVRYILYQKSKILELQRMLEEPSSWFIGDHVEKDGALFTATPIDPLFLVLPFLEKNRKKTDSHEGYFASVQDILVSDTCRDVRSLITVEGLHLSELCDLKEIKSDDDSEKFYRLNDDLVVKWLRKKVCHLFKNLPDLAPTAIATSSSFASTFVTKAKPTAINRDELLHSALGFISEYVAKHWMEKVASSFGLSDFEPTKPNLQNFGHYEMEKKDKDSSKKMMAPVVSSTQKKLAVAAKGSSSIMSFFSPNKKQKN